MVDVPALDSSVVRWSAPASERADRPLLVMLHGYGSNEHDLISLAPHLPQEFVFASVRAPLTPPWPSPGHSWYPIEGLDSRDPEHITAAATRLIEWVDVSSDADSVGLLGFSQGAAVSLQALRLDPVRFEFAVTLSGYAAPGDLPGDDALALSKPPVFWGRGAHDDVIPEFLIAHTTDWLPAHADLSGRVYPDLGHSVSESELADIRTFLERRLESRPSA